jgi:enhancer of mRNA-decapping protein 4
MLHQLDVTVANGLMEHSQNIERSLKEPINLASALQSSLDSARMLVDNLGSQGQSVSRTLSNSTIGSYRSPRSHDHKAEIKSLIASGRYEEAFAKALSLQDLSIVSWICSNVDAATVLSSTNSLSQMVLLSLLQQLAADLSGNTATKLQWVREAAMTINPTDHTIAAHIKPVLEHVLASLQTILPSLQPEDASSCKLALHVVRSQLSS